MSGEHYEKARKLRISRNKAKVEALGIPVIAAWLDQNGGDLKKSKSLAKNDIDEDDRDSNDDVDYSPESDDESDDLSDENDFHPSPKHGEPINTKKQRQLGYKPVSGCDKVSMKCAW